MNRKQPHTDQLTGRCILVPLEPTKDMLLAGSADLRMGDCIGTLVRAAECWKAMLAASPTPPAEQPPRWVERWHGSGGKEFWEGWSILNAANREMIAHLGPDVDPGVVRGIVTAHNDALCGECAGTGGRWCPACAGATPSAEQQAAPKAAPGESKSIESLSNKELAERLRCDARGGVSVNVWEMDEAARRLEAAPQQEAQEPSADVQAKIGSNTWDHFGDILPTLKAISRGDWYWGANTRCKYIEIRIDTRDGGCILYDSKRVRISPQQFAHQSHDLGKMDPWPAKNALGDTAPQPAPAPLSDDAKDAARYRWLRDEGFTFADVDLGTDSDGDDFVAYRIRFHLPEPAHSKFEDDEWTGPDIDAAIDAALTAQGGQ